MNLLNRWYFIWSFTSENGIILKNKLFLLLCFEKSFIFAIQFSDLVINLNDKLKKKFRGVA